MARAKVLYLSLLLLVEYLRLADGLFFDEKKLGEITPMNPLGIVNEILELNCTVFEDSGLNVSMLFWEDYTGKRVPEDTMIAVGKRTLLLKKNITSVAEEGMYACRRLNGDEIAISSLVIECEAVRNITNFTCILYKSWDEFTCTWELGLYHHPAYLEISASVSMDNVGLISCPQNDKEKCTWTSDNGAINSVLKIVILEIKNRKYNITKSFRRVYSTREITKYDPPKSIQAMNQDSTNCACAIVLWEGISGGVDTSSRVTLKSKWETSDISVEIDRNTSLTICDMVPASMYVVQVQVKPSGGLYYSDINKTSFVTCSREPSKAPSVNVSGYSSGQCYDSMLYRQVTVYWKKIPKQFQNGPLTNYTISSGDVNVGVSPDNSFGEIEIPCKASSIVIIKGCNNDGCSPEATTIIPRFGEVVLPTKVIVEHVNASRVELSWFHRQGQTAVDVVWCNGRSGALQCRDEIELLRMNGSDTRTSLSSRDINSKIDGVYFGVAIINDKQLSGGIKWQDACRYQKNIEPMKIMDVKLLPDAPENSLIVSWSPILCDTSNINNAYIHSYEIISCRLDSENHCIGDESSVDLPATDNTQYTLRNLHSEANYGVWIRAKSLDKSGPRSDMVSGIPTNNDLPTSAVAGIIVAGSFVFVLVLAGGICILRNIKHKLGLDETFPIHMPNLECKPGETKLNASVTAFSSPNCISSEAKESCGLSQSAETVSDHCYSQEMLLNFLIENPTYKHPQTNDTPLALSDISTDIGSYQRSQDEMAPLTVANSKSALPITNQKDQQRNEEATNEVLPPDYAKATTDNLTCLHELERSPVNKECGTYDSSLYSTQETAFSVDDKLKQTDINPKILEEGNSAKITPIQNSKNDKSFSTGQINDESYVPNDLKHWYNERQHSMANANNENDQCQKFLPFVVKQSVDCAESRNMYDNLLGNLKTTFQGNVNANTNNASSLNTITSTIDREDYSGNNHWSKDGVHINAEIKPDQNSRNIVIDSSDCNKQLTNDFNQSAEMCAGYVPNDTLAGLESSRIDMLYTKQLCDYLPNDMANKSVENIDHVGYILYSGAMEGNF